MAHQKPSLAAEDDRSATPETARFLELIAEELVATDELFRQELRSDVPFIDQAGEYIFAGGGKRVRPALLLLSAQLLGRGGQEPITYAAVVELIHTATLIHDDIIDHATLRRSQPTLNHLWGNSRTVLLGDWLYTTAMEMALRHDNLEVVRALCAATSRMTEGELMALERLGHTGLTVDEYFAIIDRKTAHLFAAACTIPSLIRPANGVGGTALSDYGEKLGVCFQLVDDLLDFTARESELGKPVLSDLKEGKLTLPLILLLPRLDARHRKAIDFVLEDGDFLRTSREEILELVSSAGTIEEVSLLASSYAEEARAALSCFPPSPAREALESAPDFVLRRRS